MTETTDKSSQESPQTTAAVVVAAGRGERAGKSHGPKQYREIGGKAVIAHAVDAFLTQPRISTVVAVVHADDLDLFKLAVPCWKELTIVTGGPTRQDSVRLGLQALRRERPNRVLIHDAARPFVDGELIGGVVSAIGENIGALPALPVSDTLKSAPAGMVEATVPRDGLFAAQTPQGFPYSALLEAHEKAHAAGRSDFTDDAAIAEWAGMRVKIVAGSPDNIKITWPRDIYMANQRLAAERYPDVRTGNGYDVHSFEAGDQVTLCGVKIPHGRKLSGHSDADVGLHALTDALLATCGAGDIGTHFPPSDPQWKGAASRLFVEHAARIVRSHGGRIAKADITLICEAPKIAPHRQAMTEALAAMLSISADRISIKATTNEKLGFVGREEGIAAIATASVIYPGEVPA